ncbi:MAG: hypothetical protein ACE5KM_18420, partial [Planctomycetaceae bacterium]
LAVNSRSLYQLSYRGFVQRVGKLIENPGPGCKPGAVPVYWMRLARNVALLLVAFAELPAPLTP